MFNTSQHQAPPLRILGGWLENTSLEMLSAREVVTNRPWAGIKPAAFSAVGIQGVEQQYLVLWIFKAFELIRLPLTLPGQEIANYLSMAGAVQLLQGRGVRIGRNYRRSAQNTLSPVVEGLSCSQHGKVD